MCVRRKGRTLSGRIKARARKEVTPRGTGKGSDAVHNRGLVAGVKWGEDGKEFDETVRGSIKKVLEGAMEGDIIDRLGAGLYKRVDSRRGYRNGYRYRSPLIRIGLIGNLRLPRDRAGELQTQAIGRYHRYASVWVGGHIARKPEASGMLFGEGP
ncbi:MAG: hypothetical protein DRI39_02415 [Chloroflexi bacterium]|nr:MAG: hypothetical protein DRI39_02415 [Chloroflexota bacterium]